VGEEGGVLRLINVGCMFLLWIRSALSCWFNHKYIVLQFDLFRPAREIYILENIYIHCKNYNGAKSVMRKERLS